MTALNIETQGSTHNPLDMLEEMVVANEWPFDRVSEEEMVVEINGRWCEYRLFFMWQAEVSAMQFSCQYDMKVPPGRKLAVAELLAEINPKMWLGHFDVCHDQHTPMFRQTTLLRGARAASAEQLEDLMDIAMSECERFYPAFQFVIWGGKTPAEAVSAAILDTVGEA